MTNLTVVEQEGEWPYLQAGDVILGEFANESNKWVFHFFEDEKEDIAIEAVDAVFIASHLNKLNGAFKTVSVSYPTSTTQYTFMTYEDCKVGDKAVVFTNRKWSVVTIVEIRDEPQLQGSYDYTWLVQVIDRTDYDRRIIEQHTGTPTAGKRL